MSFSSLADLEALLQRLRLVDSAHLQEARRSLGSRVTMDALIRQLESQGALTAYQSGKLLKKETDLLRLGRYKLLYRNASGSFARVFRACSVDDQQVVAMKVLRQRFLDNARAVSLFRREGELGKRLQHKNIVPIYEVGSDGEQHYFSMEFVEGGNFRDFIKIRRKFSPPEATKYLLDMAEGLEYALALGMTHRDLKLSNVLLSSQGVAKLVDFGLAGQDQSLAAIDEEVDRAIEYATLENGTAAPDNDPRSDLYFLGAIYYELLTGQAPYPPTRSREERRSFSRYRDVRPIRQVDPELPTAVLEVATQLMAIHPRDRYQTPTEVVADLRRIARDAVAVGNGGGESLPTVKASVPTVVCVENRTKQQDALREYFTKHGYRVLVLTDPVRALNRVESDGAAGLVLIADALGDEVISVYQTAIKRCGKKGTAIVLALSKKQDAIRNQLSETAASRVLNDGVTLRDIRKALLEVNASKL